MLLFNDESGIDRKLFGTIREIMNVLFSSRNSIEFLPLRIDSSFRCKIEEEGEEKKMLSEFFKIYNTVDYRR